jgi:NADH:ubiquinone oxidoreductase subunit 2 (subunit N)
MVNVTNYVLSLPLILLAIFAVGTLVMDRMFPPEWKWLNAITALIGIAFSAGGVAKIQYTQAELERSGIQLQVGFQHALVVDSFAIFFYYLLLAGGALAVLIAIRRSPPELAPRGTLYVALLCAMIGLMCMVSGFNLGLIFGGVAVSEAAGSAMVRSLCREEPGRSAARR